ncbi:restriction endonuclease subunit S [Streptomyces sp. NPDC102283]|uniref:restriction endonuclease subunit S n=1 Tax=Streptomyces sp. NPDC102283 TaxID=3366155 RepID=UPI003827809F
MSAEPDEIRWVPVGEVGEVRMGKQLSPTSSQADGMHAPYLRVANVLDGWIDYSDVKTMRFSPLERQKYGLEPGDILLNEGQSLELVGRSATYDGPRNTYCFQNTLIRFRSSHDVVPAYAREVFRGWLNDGTFASIAKKTTSIAHLGGGRFAKLSFPLIPLVRQLRIVEILDSITEVERASERAIAKLQTLREAAVDEELERFAWSSQLKDFLAEDPRNGFSPLESSEWTGVQMLGLGCLTTEGFKPKQIKNAPPGVLAYGKALLRDGDLLMSRANTRSLVGLCGIYRDIGTPCIYPDLMMRLRLASGVSAEFIEILLGSGRVRREVQGVAQGTSGSMVKISSQMVQGICVPLPGASDQKRISAVVREFNGRIVAETEALRKIRRMRGGIVDRLIGGRLDENRA